MSLYTRVVFTAFLTFSVIREIRKEIKKKDDIIFATYVLGLVMGG